MQHLVEEALTESVIGAFFDVYNTLGFGFLEHIYVMALERELLARGHHVAREVCVRVRYKGEELAQQRIEGRGHGLRGGPQLADLIRREDAR
jgi:hypothetical protein